MKFKRTKFYWFDQIFDVTAGDPTLDTISGYKYNGLQNYRNASSYIPQHLMFNLLSLNCTVPQKYYQKYIFVMKLLTDILMIQIVRHRALTLSLVPDKMTVSLTADLAFNSNICHFIIPIFTHKV